MKKLKKPFFRRLILFSFIILFGLTTICITSLDTKAYTTDISTLPLNGSSVRLHIPIRSNTSLTINIEYDNSNYRLAYIDNSTLYVFDWSSNTYRYVAYLNSWYLVFDLDYDLSVEDGISYYDCSYSFVYYSQVDENFLILNDNVRGRSDTLLLGIVDNTPMLVVGGSLSFPDFVIGTFLIEENSAFDNDSYLDIARSSILFIKSNFMQFLDRSYESGYARGYNDGVLGSDTSIADFGTVILDMANNFLSFEILPNFSLLNILHLCLAIGFVFVILRFFAGG